MAIIKFNKNKKKKTEELDGDVEVYNEKIETEFELSIRKFKQKQQRIHRIKNIAKGMVIFFIAISLLRVFTFKDYSNEHQATALQSQTFVKRYVQHYFAFPKSEETTHFLSEFTLQNVDNVLLEYQKIKTAYISDVEIYGVKQQGNDFVYNISATLNTVSNEEAAQEEKQPIYFTLHVTQLENKYTVTSPILLEYAKTQAISKTEYDEYKKKIQKKTFGGENLGESLLKETETSIKLFFETWSKDVNQATILMENKQLNPLSPGSKIELTTIQTAAMTEKEIQLKAETLITIKENITQKKVFTILIDRTTNKIKELREE